MQKMRKIALLCVVMFFTLAISGCSGTKKLERALEELENKSYTVEGDMKVDMTISYSGESETQSMSADMLIEADSTQTYTVTTAEGVSQYSYAKIEGNMVKVYTKLDSTWELLETVSLDEYDDDITSEIVDIDTDDAFKKEGNVWVGDTVKLTDELDDYMAELAEQFGGTSLTINSTTVDKYNIELDGKHIKKIDIEMTISMSMQGMTITMKVSMPLTFSKIGETQVTVPDSLPTE